MKLASITLSVALATIVVAAPATTKSGKTLSVPVVNRRHNSQSKSKRDVKEDLVNEWVTYIASIEVGTPAQTVDVGLDTGSSDLWIYTPEAGVPDVQGLSGSVSYDPTKSSTYHYLKDGFSINYVLGSATGDWVSDNVGLGGATVKDQRFGAVANNVNMSTGVFGIGLKSLESSANALDVYDNFPASLVKQGIIDSNAYSLYLDNYEASSGFILFGGIDNAKYSGDLFDVQLQSDTTFSVDVTVSGSEFLGILDSGTSYTYIPDDAAEAVAQEVGAQWDQDFKCYTFDGPTSNELTFDFGSGKITIPSSELSIPATQFDQDSDKYILPIFPNSQIGGYTLLGDTFLRSAYVVYDLDNLKVSLAQASFSDDSDVVAIAAKK